MLLGYVKTWRSMAISYNLVYIFFILNLSSIIIIMQNPQVKEPYMLHIKAVTWHKDSHSLFDYQFNKNVNQETFDLPLNPKLVFMYRNNKTSEITLKESDKILPKDKSLQLLGAFELKHMNKRYKVEFHHASQYENKKTSESNKTQQSNELIPQKQQDIYLIVRSLKNKNNQNKGYKIDVGQIIKLGRVQYKVSTIKKNNQISSIETKNYFANTNIMEWTNPITQEQTVCKYCLEGELQGQNSFFISPCKCSGSAGLVHFKCLQQWIQSKVKKQVVGGTLHYNFQKFFCQLCKTQYPRFIKRDNFMHQLMHIQKPQGSHLILEGISEKSKNLMVIQNIPEDGIKIGRSHQCQIRITDISISRNHAIIEKNEDDFYIFDSKSKFGTLVRQDNLVFDLNKIKQGIQIGRTVFTFQVSRK